jgi:hypothetical protein
VGGVFVFLFMIIVDDETRVGTIILFPALFYWILTNKDLWIALSQQFLIALVVLTLVFPVVYVYRGYPYGSLWRYDWVARNVLGSEQFNLRLPFARTPNGPTYPEGTCAPFVPCFRKLHKD